MSIFGQSYDYEDDLFVVTDDLDMNENRIKELRNPQDGNDAVNKRYMNKRIEYKTKDLENKINKLQQLLDGTKPMTSKLDMGKNKIINVAQPGNPEHDVKYENDIVTSKYLYEYVKIADKRFLKANEDNVLDGKLDMNQHKIVGLSDPVDSDDAATKRYVSSRFQALIDEINQIRSRIDRFERFLQQ